MPITSEGAHPTRRYLSREVVCCCRPSPLFSCDMTFLLCPSVELERAAGSAKSGHVHREATCKFSRNRQNWCANTNEDSDDALGFRGMWVQAKCSLNQDCPSPVRRPANRVLSAMLYESLGTVLSYPCYFLSPFRTSSSDQACTKSTT